MSENNDRLKISDEAYDDLVNIQNYTYQNYGESGWKDYGDALDAAITHIMLHPHSGYGREDIPPGYQVWNVKEHVMVYRVEGGEIYLVRVLHNKMNFRFQF